MNQKDIDNALKDLSNCIISDKLKDVKVVLIRNKVMKRDFPERYLGGFAAACHVKSKIFDSALRIWTKKIDNIKDRTKKISKYLETVKTQKKYFYTYEYIDNAMRIGGEIVDVILMDWISGQTLYKFIESNLDKPDNLLKVADNCMELFKWMRANKISHGDLQHGNIIVDSKFNVHLCDYDSVCVPGTEGMNIVTPGLTGYQHPLRFTEKNQKASFSDDFFSEVVIYAGLLTLASNPNLWNHEDSNDPYLLLSEFDIKAIREGKIPSIIEKINKIQDKKVQGCNQLLLQNIKCKKLSEIKTFDEVINTDVATKKEPKSTVVVNQPKATKEDKNVDTKIPAKSPKQSKQHQKVTVVMPSNLGVCPHCKHPLNANDYLHCHYCGQKLSKPFNL